MKVAWFRPGWNSPADPLDQVTALVAELDQASTIERFDERRAHDFVWMHFRRQIDVPVYELEDTAAHAFIWPYLLHYPGVLWLRSRSLHDSRAVALRRSRRMAEYAREAAFGRGDLLRAPLLASRLVVVNDAYVAERLQEEHATAAIRHVPLGIGQPSAASSRPAFRERPANTITVGVLSTSKPEAMNRAVHRAREAGTRLDVFADAPREQIIGEADVIVVLQWPVSADSVAAAVAALAAAKPVIVFDAEATAGWPTLDPQTWNMRALTGNEAPIAVSIDPRDEEHSLMLAIRRLAADADLRREIGVAAGAWWRAHATLDSAVHAWRSILDEARSTIPPARPPDWPRHLAADGTEDARAILQELGVAVDILG